MGRYRLISMLGMQDEKNEVIRSQVIKLAFPRVLGSRYA